MVLFNVVVYFTVIPEYKRISGTNPCKECSDIGKPKNISLGKCIQSCTNDPECAGVTYIDNSVTSGMCRKKWTICTNSTVPGDGSFIFVKTRMYFFQLILKF